MPIYEYICRTCQAHTEVIQKTTDAPLTTCAHCGGEVYRPISRTSFQLKGSGWYKDGYASGGGGKASETENTGKQSESRGTATEATTSPSAAPTTKTPSKLE